mgnify:CR=1 FL=1
MDEAEERFQVDDRYSLVLWILLLPILWIGWTEIGMDTRIWEVIPPANAVELVEFIAFVVCISLLSYYTFATFSRGTYRIRVLADGVRLRPHFFAREREYPVDRIQLKLHADDAELVDEEADADTAEAVVLTADDGSEVRVTAFAHNFGRLLEWWEMRENERS